MLVSVRLTDSHILHPYRQDSTPLSVFLAILAHKGLAGITLGSTLLLAAVNQSQFLTTALAFSAATPFGVGFGVLISSYYDSECGERCLLLFERPPTHPNSVGTPPTSPPIHRLTYTPTNPQTPRQAPSPWGSWPPSPPAPSSTWRPSR